MRSGFEMVMIPIVLSGLLVIGHSRSTKSALPCTSFGDWSEIPECAWRDRAGEMHLTGKALAKLHFDNHGLAAVIIGPDMVYVAPDGRTAITLKFDNGPDYFKEGLTRIVRSGKVGFADSTLKVVIKPEWDFAWPGGRAIHRRDRRLQLRAAIARPPGRLASQRDPAAICHRRRAQNKCRCR